MIRAALDGREFLSGAAPAYGDYIVFGAFGWARAISDFPLLSKDDDVYAWRARMVDLFDGMAGKAVGYDL